MSRPGCCPTCDVGLEVTTTSVRCWKCGWEVREVDDPRRFDDLRWEVER